MPIVTFDITDNLRPNYPNNDDRNIHGYFSHVKSWSNRDGGIYIPPTNGEYQRFSRNFNLNYRNFTFDERILNIYEPLKKFDFIHIIRDPARFKSLLLLNPRAHMRTGFNSVGTESTQIILTAMNMYVLCKRAILPSANIWKVDYIQSCRDDMDCRQEDIFRGPQWISG